MSKAFRGTPETKNDKYTLWGQDGDELLIHYSADEAIEDIIDGRHPDPIDSIGKITVYEYEPRDVNGRYFYPLEWMLEILDEEYGDPNDCGTEPTEKMKAAEKVFVDAVLSEYLPWTCEQSGKAVTVNALDWVRENRPDWLKDAEAEAPQDTAAQETDDELDVL